MCAGSAFWGAARVFFESRKALRAICLNPTKGAVVAVKTKLTTSSAGPVFISADEKLPVGATFGGVLLNALLFEKTESRWCDVAKPDERCCVCLPGLYYEGSAASLFSVRKSYR